MPAKDQILGGLPLPCTCINIAAQKPAAGALYKHPTIFILPDGFIGGRQISDHCSSHKGMGCGRGIRHPQILAKLTAYDKPRHGVTFKEQIPAKWDLFSLKIIGYRNGIPFCEMPSLVEFPIHGKIALGHHTKHAPLMENRRHIVQPAFPFYRKSHHHQSIHILGSLCDYRKLPFCLL